MKHGDSKVRSWEKNEKEPATLLGDSMYFDEGNLRTFGTGQDGQVFTRTITDPRPSHYFVWKNQISLGFSVPCRIRVYGETELVRF